VNTKLPLAAERRATSETDEMAWAFELTPTASGNCQRCLNARGSNSEREEPGGKHVAHGNVVVVVDTTMAVLLPL
jgi:hypothetical protein